MIHTISAGDLGRSVTNAYELAREHNVVRVHHHNGQEMYLIPACKQAQLSLALRLLQDPEFAEEIADVVWAFQQAGKS